MAELSLERGNNRNSRLAPETMEQMLKRFNFLIFEASFITPGLWGSSSKINFFFAKKMFIQKFMRKYPGLSKFTSVQWPEGMAEEQRRQMAKEYAGKNRVGRRSTRQGRMYEMREKGTVDNPKKSILYHYGLFY
jgi:hypothetical protein